MRWRAVILVILLLVGLGLYNLPLIAGASFSDHWSTPFWQFLPASILYYVLWLVFAVPVAWLLMRFTWRDAA